MNVIRCAAIALATAAVERGPDGLPSAFLIWTEGEIPTDKGTFKLTAEGATSLVEKFNAKGVLLSIDADHLSLSEVAPPEARKAVGWHALELRRTSSGLVQLWATSVQWTDAVAAGLKKDPPEWRYFSPAFGLSSKSGEIVSYVNTALTNNPATHHVSALASVRASLKKGTSMNKEEMLAALKKMSEGENEEEKAFALKCLAAFEEKEEKKDDGEEPKKEETTKASEGADDEKKEETAVLSALASVVEKLSAKVDALEKSKESTERAALLSSRPDLDKKVVAELAKEPIAVVRRVLSLVPKTTVKLNAADNVQPTRGEDQKDGDHVVKANPELDARMGITKTTMGVKRDGNTVYFGVPVAVSAKSAGKEG